MKMDADTVNKINKLAATLRNTGLAKDMKEAVEKAKEIILGEDKKDEAIEEDQDEQIEVESKDNGFYFGPKEPKEEEQHKKHDKTHPAYDVAKEEKSVSELLDEESDEDD